MDILNTTAAPFTTPVHGALNSQFLNSFVKAVCADLTRIVDSVNNNVLKPLSTLPEGFNPESSNLDGCNIYTDAGASESKDFGIFYLKDNSRPATIYETFLLILQILANIENGMREGVSVGSFIDKVTVGPGSPLIYSWPYTDAAFEPLLFEQSGDSVTKAQLDVNVNVTNKTLTINSASSKNIWGYIWHPVLTF